MTSPIETTGSRTKRSRVNSIMVIFILGYLSDTATDTDIKLKLTDKELRLLVKSAQLIY